MTGLLILLLWSVAALCVLCVAASDAGSAAKPNYSKATLI